MLGDPSGLDAAAAATINDMAAHARIFYYSQRVGVVIDFAKYKAWLGRHPDHKRPMFLPESAEPGSPTFSDKAKGKGKGKEKREEARASVSSLRSPSSKNQQSPSPSEEDEHHNVTALTNQLDGLTTQESSQSLGNDSSSKGKGKERERTDTPIHETETPSPPRTNTAVETSSTTSPSWQSSAPRTELFVNRPEKPPSPADSGNNSNPDEPNYPLRFAEMIRMLQEGVEIPGIRQVPDTIIRDPISKPFGARVAPRKPWEKDTSTAAADDDTATPLDMVNLEFPPVDSANA